MFHILRKNFKSFLKSNCRPFYCILHGRRKDTWKKTRVLSSAAAGAFCACLLCNLVFASFVFPRRLRKWLLFVSVISLSAGFAFTESTKCVIFLVFVALMGKSGRSYLRAVCFAFVIAGPIENLSLNAGEIMRAYSCSKMLTFNLTRTRFDLLTKPFQKTLVHMKGDIKEVQKTFNELKNVTQALHREVMEDDPPLMDDIEKTNNAAAFPPKMKRKRHKNTQYILDNDPEYIQERYQNKFRKRCIQQLDSGKRRCRKAFSNSLQKCRDKMPYILKTIICWPFKIDFMCKINILGDPDRICDPSDAIPNDFGQTYVDLVEAEDSLYQNNTDVKVHYAIASPQSMPEIESAKETAKAVTKEFNRRKRFLDAILVVLEQVLAFMLIKVLFASVSYHKHYKRNIEHDNIYISEYFRQIDKGRRMRGKPGLLPLKKYEKINLIDVDNVWQRTREESRAVAFHLLQFSMESITALFFIFLDYVIVALLLVIRKNSEISFVQEGEHTIHFSVQGSGLIARLLRTTMRNFNMHETVSTYMTNEPCLPTPSILPTSFYVKLCALYVAVIFLIYHSATFLRMRRLICGYFYRKREKQRVIYLYNCLRKQRRTMREAMLKQAKLNFANRKIRLNANVFLKLRLRWPQHFSWLGRFNVARRKCVICDEYEDEHFILCGRPQCGVSYCGNCWLDMDNECLVCSDIISVEVVLNFNDFFEEFLFV